MAFDFKKEYKDLYQPKPTPAVITVPPMRFLAVRGEGDPNVEGSEYKRSIELLYGIAFTIKMSKLGDHRIEGYFDYVVPPLEGLWHQDGGAGLDLTRKSDLKFISMMRLPDFVTKSDFDWAIAEATAKKKSDFSKVEFFEYDEGLCVQCMHIGPYDDEPATLARMHVYTESNGFSEDITAERLHHEIYLGDPRRTAPERLRTVLRIPIKEVVK